MSKKKNIDLNELDALHELFDGKHQVGTKKVNDIRTDDFLTGKFRFLFF